MNWPKKLNRGRLQGDGPDVAVAEGRAQPFGDLPPDLPAAAGLGGRRAVPDAEQEQRREQEGQRVEGEGDGRAERLDQQTAQPGPGELGE
ncbi:hypothetical protein PW035_01975 [Nonomuraea angiospora]|nr:hypothetical protein [Nonomuraea angiospora]MDX3099597.1 hypothetical protein [Nonomuraea angiospora]